MISSKEIDTAKKKFRNSAGEREPKITGRRGEGIAVSSEKWCAVGLSRP